MYHYTDVLFDTIEEQQESSQKSNNRKLSSKQRRKKQRNNRKLKNSYFKSCVENKTYNKTNFQADCDHVMDILGYY